MLAAPSFNTARDVAPGSNEYQFYDYGLMTIVEILEKRAITAR